VEEAARREESGQGPFSRGKFDARKPMSRALIVIGLAIAAVGLLWPWIARSGLGRLPGDIWIHRGNFTFYAPITTSILVSVVVSLVLWLMSR
jgi:hypothetical protein